MWQQIALLCTVFSVLESINHLQCDKSELQRLINGVKQSINYMDKHSLEINLDGAIGARILKDQLKTILSSPPMHKLPKEISKQLQLLEITATKTLKKAIPAIKEAEPQYFKSMGATIENNVWDLWYPIRWVNLSLQKKPLKCSEMHMKESASDKCIIELYTKRYQREKWRCEISEECWDMETTPLFKGYQLTHQVLYFQIAEMQKCLESRIDKTDYEEFLQHSLCSNVLRDAEKIANNNYPESDRDLFLEQIGLCGMWGFADFYKKEWLEEMLKWQDSSGCFIHRTRYSCDGSGIRRFKREDKLLKDGCSSHMTTVALVAFSTNLRFCMEAVATARA